MLSCPHIYWSFVEQLDCIHTDTAIPGEIRQFTRQIWWRNKKNSESCTPFSKEENSAYVEWIITKNSIRQAINFGGVLKFEFFIAGACTKRGSRIMCMAAKTLIKKNESQIL